MTNFALVFSGALLLNAVVTFRSSGYYKNWVKGSSGNELEKVEDTANDEKWKKLIKKYLAVYLLSTLSDWLQGPYVYALYSAYGYSQHEIAVLFVAGFGSSMVFGSFIGGMADWGGRRNFVILFAVIYAASCITKRKFISLLMKSVSSVIQILRTFTFSCWAACLEVWLPAYYFQFSMLGSLDRIVMLN